MQSLRQTCHHLVAQSRHVDMSEDPRELRQRERVLLGVPLDIGVRQRPIFGDSESSEATLNNLTYALEAPSILLSAISFSDESLEDPSSRIERCLTMPLCDSTFRACLRKTAGMKWWVVYDHRSFNTQPNDFPK